MGRKGHTVYRHKQPQEWKGWALLPWKQQKWACSLENWEDNRVGKSWQEKSEKRKGEWNIYSRVHGCKQNHPQKTD